MYYIEGMPEGSYHTALKLNKKWQDSGIGEVRVVRSFKYHGKVYCFYKDNVPFAAIIGSANLSVLKLEAANRRQYELSSLTTDAAECQEIADFIEKLKQPNCSANIGDVSDMPLIYEKNTALSGIELVTEVPPSNVEFYKRCMAYASFRLPLKVPSYAERHMDDGKSYQLVPLGGYQLLVGGNYAFPCHKAAFGKLIGCTHAAHGLHHNRNLLVV